jgi:hypothetical protein
MQATRSQRVPKRLFNLHVEFYEDDPTSNAATKPGATSSTDPELDKLEWLWGAFD